jgi:hypothetical protein
MLHSPLLVGFILVIGASRRIFSRRQANCSKKI